MGSHGLAKKTWANYKTAERLLALCCIRNHIKLELPLSEDTTLQFVIWLAYERKVGASTIKNYLAGIRQLHINKGVRIPELHTEMVNLVIKGKQHKDAARNRIEGKEERQPVTPDILRLLKARLGQTDMSNTDKRLVWAVCTSTFFGAFRIHEILSRETSQFDPSFTLCGEDIQLITAQDGSKSLQYRIKAPKENKVGRSVLVDVFEAPADICPVRAFEKWTNHSHPMKKGQPAFRWATVHFYSLIT